MAINYDKLAADLNHANQVACQAVRDIDDGGTANRDSVFLRLPRARERSVLAAIHKAGLYCRRKSQWLGQGYFITPTSGGQGDKRAKAVEIMAKTLNDRGWDALTFEQMD
ncbi:hypothetical protein ACPT9H_00285 [Brevibacillus borstelensis]|jgi:hypothetical protein|uniref:hypothetical protein n=1 Tax=Brevibacillus borstelensis TaxID=45462 RepID=UPI003CE548BF